MPARTQTPTITPTEGSWEACPGSYLSRLHVDDSAYVSFDPPLANRVRSEPGKDGTISGLIQLGEEVKILDGPACEEGWVWWEVRSKETGLVGWTSEGDHEDYWLVPIPKKSEITPSMEYGIVQIGFFDSIYLRYDPDEWESFNEFGEQPQTNKENKLVYALRHQAIPGCIIHGNLGFGPPTTWRRQDTNLMIGNLEYRVETWTDINTRQPVLIVYQYPLSTSGFGKRVEIRIDQEPDLCIEYAEKVLFLSEDLIMGNAADS